MAEQILGYPADQASGASALYSGGRGWEKLSFLYCLHAGLKKKKKTHGF